ncbi:hypothetical protein [Amycolatopsis pittospori]|nr:hypothetical protein [Amycolatopsis pittospori]
MRKRDWAVGGVAFVLLVVLIAALVAGLIFAAWFVLTHLPAH